MHAPPLCNARYIAFSFFLALELVQGMLEDGRNSLSSNLADLQITNHRPVACLYCCIALVSKNVIQEQRSAVRGRSLLSRLFNNGKGVFKRRLELSALFSMSGGLTLGWPALALMLQQVGVYNEDCQEQNEGKPLKAILGKGKVYSVSLLQREPFLIPLR